METEFRFFEFRQEGRALEGVAIKYGSTARVGRISERFIPGAFGDISAVDAILNVNHERGRPLARTAGGGLTLTDSPELLSVRAELPQTVLADETLELIRLGVLRGLSIEFIALVHRISAGIRLVSSARLRGVSVVDRAAYPDSTVQARRELPARRRVWL